jgi:sigma-B regulation protein RsbU (phosphoserine phosphatase)
MGNKNYYDKNILIVDDIEANVEVIKEILESNNFENVIGETNPKIALEILEKRKNIEQEKIHLILLDLMMPEISGYDFIDYLKKDDILKEIPIIVVTAVNTLESMRKTFLEGILDYIAKPVSMNSLLNRVYTALEIVQLKLDEEKRKKHFEDELKLAKRIQKSFLPELICNENFNICSLYKPLNIVGGDFYDYFTIGENRYCFYMADVVGHGIPSAFVTIMLKSLTKNFDYKDFSTKKFLNYLNSFFNRNYTSQEILNLKFSISVIFIDFNEKIIKYSLASHPDPIFIDYKNKKIKKLSNDGFFIGIFDEFDYEENTISFNSEDKLILYTDGIYDFIDNETKKIFGFDNFYKLCETFIDKSLCLDFFSYLKKEIVDNPLINLTDDLAVLAIELK